LFLEFLDDGVEEFLIDVADTEGSVGSLEKDVEF
jgi:hypothetical protein